MSVRPEDANGLVIDIEVAMHRLAGHKLSNWDVSTVMGKQFHQWICSCGSTWRLWERRATGGMPPD